MAPAANLYRRTSGVYVVRLAVPERLRPAVGKREIHVSTGSRVLALAKTVAAGVLGHWREKFLDLERLQLMDVERLVAGSPELSIDSWRPTWLLVSPTPMRSTSSTIGAVHTTTR